MSRTSTIRLSWRWSLLMLAVATTLATLAPMSAFAGHNTNHKVCPPPSESNWVKVDSDNGSVTPETGLTISWDGRDGSSNKLAVTYTVPAGSQLELCIKAGDDVYVSGLLTGSGIFSATGNNGISHIGYRISQAGQDIPVTAGVTFTDPTCENPTGSWTGTQVTGVTYALTSGTVGPGNTVTVTATAATGYALTNGPTFTHTFAAAPSDCGGDTDVAAGVQFIDPSCANPTGGYTTTSVTGVTYQLTSGTVGPGNTVVVTAEAAEGYKLTNGPTFTHTFGAAPTNCSSPDPDPDPDPEPATLGASFEVVCDDVNEVVTYTVTTDDAEMTSAQLLIGDSATEISFVDGEATGQVAWPDVDSADFAVITGEGSDIAGSIARPADLDCSEVLGVIIEPEPEPAPAPDEPETQPAQLPVTGFDTGTMLALALALMLAGIAGLRFQARREQA